MNNYTNEKELRNLIFMGLTIILALVVCITSITSNNLMGIVVSIVLLALLSAISGYIYCKYEEKDITVAKKSEPEKIKEKASGISKNIFGGISVSAQPKKEANTVENDSEKSANIGKIVEKDW
jgi:phosphotransferase system  glucose/maltose/N-acetylglucosamine-specific IIC component